MEAAERSIAIIKKYCEQLGLGDKTTVTQEDFDKIQEELKKDGHEEEAQDIAMMGVPLAFHDFITNAIYDGCDE